MNHDDRVEFGEMKRDLAAAMTSDTHLTQLAHDLLVGADRYNWAYQWTWLGLPLIQMPPDIVALQEIIWKSRPQLIIETGVARGGSVVFSASILELIGEGRVLGIDIDIREHNRAAIEQHKLSRRIDLLEGSSIDDQIISQVYRLTRGKRVMVILDSDHSHDHVLRELELYAPLVTPGQYLIVSDTGIETIPPQVHRGKRSWGPGNNPLTALKSFLSSNRDFEPPDDPNNKLLITSSPSGYLRRRADQG